MRAAVGLTVGGVLLVLVSLWTISPAWAGVFAGGLAVFAGLTLLDVDT